jgi:hypothetical protein
MIMRVTNLSHASIIFMVMLCTLGSSRAQLSTNEIDISGAIGNRYFDALDYLNKNTWIYDTLLRSNIPPDFALSIVFPNMTTYSGLKDLMETSWSRTLYVRSGRKYANYTAGRFQFKPSFVELVERNAIKHKLTNHKFLLSNTTKARSERAKRLESTEWQVKYLVLFIKIMDKRFSHVEWKSPEDKVRFYATAISVGLNKHERTIKHLMAKKTPRKKLRKGATKYRSGDIAEWFFTNDGHHFKSEIPVLPLAENQVAK